MFARNTSTAALVASLALAAGIAGCRGDATTGSSQVPDATFASGLRKQVGDVQTGPVALPLAEALTVRVVDAGGQPVQGATVNWAVMSGGGTVNPPIGTSNGQGLVTTTWTLGTTLGQNTVRAYLTRGYVLDSATFTASATSGAPAELVIQEGTAPAAAVMVASTQGPITYQVRDQFGHAVAGASVAFSVPTGSGSVSPTTAVSDANGLVSTAWTLGQIIGTRTMSAEVSGAPVRTIQVTTTPDTSRKLTVVSAAQPTTRQGLALNAPIVARTSDRFGNLTRSDTVTFNILAGGGTIDPPRVVSDSVGFVSSTWVVGAVPGPARVRAYVFRGGAIKDSVDFTTEIIPGVVTSLQVDSSTVPAASLPVRSVVNQLRFTVRDAVGLPVKDAVVTFSVAGGGSPLVSQGVDTTNSAGVVAVNWTLGEQVGTQSITASVNGRTVTITVDAVPGTVRRLSTQVQTENIVVRQGRTPAFLFEVRTADQFNNVTPGDTVVWTVIAGGGTVDPPRGLSSASGLATAVWTAGTVPGPFRVRAYLQRGTVRDSVTFSGTIIPGVPSAFVVDSTTIPAGPLPVTTRVSGIRYTLRDDLGLPVRDASITFVATGPTTDSASVPGTTVTNAEGVATVSWRLGTKTGRYVLKATVGDEVDSIVVNATPDASRELVRDTLNDGSQRPETLNAVLAGTASTDTIVVAVQDKYKNRVSGVPIAFAEPNPTGGVVIPINTTTDSLGEARVFFRTGIRLGATTLRATSTAAPGQQIDHRPQAMMSFRDIYAGNYFACGVGVDDRAYCWGFGLEGQLGSSKDSTQSAPGWPVRSSAEIGAPVPNFREITGGDSHACGLTISRGILCWGSAPDGRAIISGNVVSNIALDVAASGNRAQFASTRIVTASQSFSCAVTLGGILYCYGNDERGQLGGGPGEVDTTGSGGAPSLWSHVATGQRHACATPRSTLPSAGRVWCWGANDNGQLGIGSFTDTARLVSPGPGFIVDSTSLVAGGVHTCALEAGSPSVNRKAWCWGGNGFGQLGTGAAGGSVNTPTAVSTAVVSGFTRLYAGEFHTCGLTVEGVAYCWGRNDRGQLGNSTFANSAEPVAVTATTDGPRRFRNLALGELFTCGVVTLTGEGPSQVGTPGTEGSVYCWGDNEYGQLGQGVFSMARTLIPTRVINQPVIFGITP